MQVLSDSCWIDKCATFSRRHICRSNWQRNLEEMRTEKISLSIITALILNQGIRIRNFDCSSQMDHGGTSH